MQMFADFAEEIPTAIPPKTTLAFAMLDVRENDKVNEDDPKRRDLIIDFEVVDNGNPEYQEIIGMKPASLWISYWEDLTKPEYDAFTDKQKKTFVRGMETAKALARALGFTEAALSEFTPDMFKSKVSEVIAMKVYRDEKNSVDRIETSSITAFVPSAV